MPLDNQPAARTGLKTTEFWLVLLTNILVPIMAHFEQVPGLVGVLIMSALTAIYAVLRSALKNNLTNNPDK